MDVPYGFLATEAMLSMRASLLEALTSDGRSPWNAVETRGKMSTTATPPSGPKVNRIGLAIIFV